MPNRAVLFDLDNTLHDRDKGLRNFLAAQHTRHQLAIPSNEWTETFLRLDDHGRVWKDKVYQALSETYNLPVSANQLLHEYDHEFASHLQPHDGYIETLETIRQQGWKTALITNGLSTFQRRTIKALAIEPLLDVILISEECNLRKPDPKIFRLALEKLDCEPQNAWFIGDDPVNDYQGATSAGLYALLFAPSAHPGLNKVAALPEVLDRIQS